MLINPEVTDQALAILRNGDNFQWYVITLLALVMYIYTNEISRKELEGDRRRTGALYGALVL